ncbi:MAG TPA: GAF domain-containing sensor histidine kinase, partial [Polyangiaceae bacterium]
MVRTWHGFRWSHAIAPEDTLSVEARFLNTLQDLMELPALELGEALTLAAEHIAAALNCDKVDAFLFSESKQTLLAIGTSATPMGRLQRAIGLDTLPLANGGSIVEVFRSGVSYLEGNALRDPNELRGVVVELGVRSSIAAAFEINGVRRGVLSAVSATPEFFETRDLQFLEAVARWMGMLAHRVELAELARKAESDHARRAAADEIITVLAHDLRNHLNPLLSRLQLMSLRIAAGKAIQSREIETALRSVRRLSTLTNDLLDVKRLDEGLFSLNLVPVDLAAIAKETAESLTTSSATIRVGGASSLVVVADGDRVRQALENIVVNAIRYSPPDRPVSINVHLDSTTEGLHGVLEVVDQGPGIDPEILPTLFERFTLGPHSKGLGLGLYVAQRIAHVHSGELTAESKPGMG